MNELHEKLEDDPDIRVLKRIKLRDQYHEPDGSQVLKGLYVDCETTGLCTSTDGVTELALIPFSYLADGRIINVHEEAALISLNDPGRPIPPEVTELTGITDAMVAGQQVDGDRVREFVEEADIILAHNASFDRPILERFWPIFSERPWGCTWADVDWRAEKIKAAKLDYLSFQFGYFFDGHRAADDARAGIHLLTCMLPVSGKLVFSSLLEKARQNSKRIWAVGAPYDLRAKLRGRGYRWNSGEDGGHKAWWIDVPECDEPDEMDWLFQEIYGSPRSLPSATITAYSRYSERVLS